MLIGIKEEAKRSAVGAVWLKMPICKLGVWKLLVLEVTCIMKGGLRIIPIAVEPIGLPCIGRWYRLFMGVFLGVIVANVNYLGGPRYFLFY